MAKTLAPISALDEIDQDLRGACLDRSKAYRRLTVKDTPANREAYEDVCADVDELLDMRNEIVSGEG